MTLLAVTNQQEDSFISSVFADIDFAVDNNNSSWTNFQNDNEGISNALFQQSWTHFQNEGNAFRSDNNNNLKKKKNKNETSLLSSPDTTQTWAESTFDESFSSPLHQSGTGTTSNNSNNRNSPLKKKPMTRDDEQKVQQLVHAIRKEYQDVNTEAAQQKVVSHLTKLEQQQQQLRATSPAGRLSYDSNLAEQETSIIVNHRTKSNISRYSEPKEEKVLQQLQDDDDFGISSSFHKKKIHDDPFAAASDDEEDDTQKPIKFLNADTTDNDAAFSDDDTLTLSLYSEDGSCDDQEEDYERAAERIHVLKESVLAILNCTICTNPMALLTGNYENNNNNDVLNISNDDDLEEQEEEIQLTVQESIDLQQDEIHL